MNYRERLNKALNNIDHLGFKLLNIYQVCNISNCLVEDKNGKCQPYTLDFFANFGWCPYCDEELGDEPFCTEHGEVSGKFDKKFYEHGRVRRHYEFEMVEGYAKGRKFTSKEVGYNMRCDLGNNTKWDGSLEGLHKKYRSIGSGFKFKSIDEWEI